MSLKQKFAKELKRALHKKGMSQAELAKTLGVPAQNMTRLVKAKSAITLDTLEKISKVLKVPAISLLGVQDANSGWLSKDELYEAVLSALASRSSQQQRTAELMQAVDKLGGIDSTIQFLNEEILLREQGEAIFQDQRKAILERLSEKTESTNEVS